MLLRWQPRFEWEVVSAGDPEAAHLGNLGAAPIGHTLRGPAAVLSAGERSWLDASGIDWASNDWTGLNSTDRAA